MTQKHIKESVIAFLVGAVITLLFRYSALPTWFLFIIVSIVILSAWTLADEHK